jgi:hypothetical protein
LWRWIVWSLVTTSFKAEDFFSGAAAAGVDILLISFDICIS